MRSVLVGATVLVAACSGARRCSVDGDCAGYATCIAGLCTANGDAGGHGGSGGTGGSGGSGASGGDGGGGFSACSCPASMECVPGGCAARYESLSLEVLQANLEGGALIPVAHVNAAGAVLRAHLEAAARRTGADPDVLSLSAQPATLLGYFIDDAGFALLDDAGMPITFQPVSLTRVGPGLYERVVSFPPPEGPFAITAAFADAGLEASVSVSLDVTAPLLTTRLPAPPVRAVDGGLSARDPGHPNAFRRDEVVAVTIDSPDPDVASMFVVASGLSGFSRVFADAGCTSQFDAGTCLVAQLPLWSMPMNAFSMTTQLSAGAVDLARNVGELADAGSLEVTRYKWARQLPAALVQSVALGSQGQLVVGGSALNARIDAYGPEGNQLWSKPFAGYTATRVMTGQSVAYAQGMNSAQNYRFESAAFDLATGAVITPLVAQVQLTRLPPQPLLLSRAGNEVAQFHVDDTSGGALMLGWSSATQAGVNTSVSIDAGTLPSFTLRQSITDNQSIFAIATRQDAAIAPMWRFDTDDAGTASRGSFTAVGGDFWSAALADRNSPVLGHGRSTISAAIVRVGVDGGADAFDVALQSPAVVVARDAVIAGDLVGGQPQRLCRLGAGSVVPVCVGSDALGFPILGAPFAGGALLYSTSATGTQAPFTSPRITAYDALSLTPVWNTPAVFSDGFALVHALDCSRTAAGLGRPGAPGVLYATSYSANTSVLSAFIVDSPGIDALAPWPMQNHDPRNTNNLTTPNAPFSCP